jgi:hypothetical protein
MKYLAVAMAASSLICGLVAAWYWYRASKIPFQPDYHALPDDVSDIEFHGALVTAVMKAVQKAGALNRLAALWTAAAVVLGGVAGLIGTLQPH